MKNVLLVLLVLLVLSVRPILSATLRSPSADGFTIETNAVPSLSPTVQTGFSESTNGKPMRIAISANFIDYGPITPTNPIKRKINITTDAGASFGVDLYVYENRSLSTCHAELGSASNETLKQVQGDNNCDKIPDTTCDNGACSENTPSTWTNPFTFGFGYSFDGLLYKQFADLSKNEPMTAIAPQEMIVKVNAGQSFDYAQDKALDSGYQNTLIFLVLPKI